MKRILFVVHTLQIGGAEKVLIDILDKIDKTKFNITVLAIVDDGLYKKNLEEIKEVKYKYLFKTYFKKSRNNKNSKFYKISNKIMDIIWKWYILLLKYIPKTLYKKAVKKEEYDVEIAFLEGKISKFVANSNNKKSMKIAWIHTDINNEPKINIFKNLKEEIDTYKKFNKIICVSGGVKENFIKKTGINENIYVQINPVNSKQIIEKSEQPITKKLNKKGLIVCTVGRLVKEKGYSRLLQIHNKLIKEGIIHTLWIIGDGEERGKLEAYIKENGLEETVNIVGYEENPYKYIKNSDIYVCSSIIEGLSVVRIEATVLEKVILTTNCSGTKEIFGENGQTAMVVENDTESLYNGLKQLLTDSKVREQFAKNIKERSKLLDIENEIHKIEEIIEKADDNNGFGD